jgi:hypothetical protein
LPWCSTGTLPPGETGEIARARVRLVERDDDLRARSTGAILHASQPRSDHDEYALLPM